MDITAANAILMIAIPPIFPTPIQIQRFAMDDIYAFDEIESVETMMGVDGVLSGGFVFKPQAQTIMLMADSPSNDIFDTWSLQQIAGLTTYLATGILTLPAIGRKFIQTNGYLTRYQLPGAKKLLQPRRYGITWNLVAPAPT